MNSEMPATGWTEAGTTRIAELTGVPGAGARASIGPHTRKIGLIDRRLIALAHGAYCDPDAGRLAARLSRRRDEVFTFLDRPEAGWENNSAERQVRPAVILRKNSRCNRSQRGAAAQAVLTSCGRRRPAAHLWSCRRP